jgi:hypothetical protein
LELSLPSETGTNQDAISNGLMVVARLLSIQHRLNPLHLYCRLLDAGLSRDLSASLCRSYEIILFLWISSVIKGMVRLCCVLNQRTSVEEVIRKI